MPCTKGKPSHVPNIEGHVCTMVCDCKTKIDTFSIKQNNPLDLLKCGNGAPAITVETWVGIPESPGSTSISSVPLELCDKLQFYTEGTTELIAQVGSWSPC